MYEPINITFPLTDVGRITSTDCRADPTLLASAYIMWRIRLVQQWTVAVDDKPLGF